MKKIGLLIVVGILISINLAASSKCVCNESQNSKSSPNEFIHNLDKSDFEFTSQIETTSVRGVVRATYYYCDDNHGFLLVKLHDNELIYKNVPLETWFEFKFSDSSNSYYKYEIKYNYITI